MPLNTLTTIAAHSNLNVEGVTMFDIDEVPMKPTVPCGFPVFFDSNSELFIPTSTAATGDVTVNFAFLFLIEEMTRNLDINIPSESVVTKMDVYLNAVIGNPDFNSTINFDPIITIELGVFPWWANEYGGFIARHQWQYLVG